MLQQMKKKLIDDINLAKESGELTIHQVYGITRNGVVKTAQSWQTVAKDLREITKEAVTTMVQALVDTEEASEEKISAALHGAVDGIREVESQILDATHKELSQTKKHLLEKEVKLAEGLNEAFEGAREAAGNFTDEVRIDIETALVDAKLKSTELLGLTRGTVKEAVRKAIETGIEVEEIIVNVTRDATSMALAEAHFTSTRVRKVSEMVLSAAVEAAEESGSYIFETASAVTEGVRQGLIGSVEHTRESVANAGKGVKEYATEELEQTKEDLEVVSELFVESLRNVADKSGKIAKEILHDLADDANKAGSSLREKAFVASRTVMDQLKESGNETLDKTEKISDKAAEETKKLGERMLAVAKGAAMGMWEGATKSYYKVDKKEGKS